MGLLGSLSATVGSLLGLGPDSAAAQTANAAAQNQVNGEVTAAEEQIRAQTNLIEQAQANRQTEGAQRVAISGSGVTVSTGSPLDAQTATYIQDQFKDRVAVFNGEVNVNADQASVLAGITEANAASSQAESSAVSSDVGIYEALKNL